MGFIQFGEKEKRPCFPVGGGGKLGERRGKKKGGKIFYLRQGGTPLAGIKGRRPQGMERHCQQQDMGKKGDEPKKGRVKKGEIEMR